MGKNFKITEEEINHTILRSPYSLADSPSRQGMTPAQIKRYFYEFIRFLAEKINGHLDEIGTDADATSEQIEDLKEMDTFISRVSSENLASHNVGTAAHEDIRKKIGTDIGKHNTNSFAHIDIRDEIKVVKDKACAAFSLASGRQRVYPCQDLMELCDVLSSEKPSPGDMILVLDPSVCDFIVYESGVSSAAEYANNPYDIRVTVSDIANGEVEFEPSKVYYVDGTRIYATQGTLETGLLAKNEALEELKALFLENVDVVSTALSDVNDTLLTKETALKTEESVNEKVTIKSSTEYNLGLRTSVVLEIDEPSDFDEAIVNFRAGETPTSFDAPSNLYFSGDDCLDGRLYPNKNRIYEINVKSVMGIYVARVGACDFTVVE